MANESSREGESKGALRRNKKKNDFIEEDAAKVFQIDLESAPAHSSEHPENKGVVQPDFFEDATNKFQRNFNTAPTRSSSSQEVKDRCILISLRRTRQKSSMGISTPCPPTPQSSHVAPICYQ